MKCILMETCDMKTAWTIYAEYWYAKNAGILNDLLIAWLALISAEFVGLL